MRSIGVLAIRSPGTRFEMINKIEIERFSLTSSKPFDQVVAALNADRQIFVQLKAIEVTICDLKKERL